MKKKFYNRFLLVAMLFATAGSYVSCKDYNEEAYSDMLGKNSQLEEVVNEQVEVLDNQIDALKEAQQECKENCEAWKKEIELWKESLKLEYVSITDFEAHIRAYNDFYTENKVQHDQIELKIVEAEKRLNEAIAALDSKVQADLLKVQNDLNNTIAGLQTQLTDLSETVKNNKIELENAIAENKKDLEDSNKELKELIATTNSNLEQIIATKSSELEQAIALGDAALAERITKEIQDIQDKFNAEIARLEQALADNNAQLMLNLKDLEDRLNSAIAAGDKELEDKLRNQVDAIEKAMAGDKAELKGLIESYKTDLEKAIADNKTALVEEINNTIVLLQGAMANDKAELKGLIEDYKNILEKAITDNKIELIEKIEDAINDLEATQTKDKAELKGLIEEVTNALEKRVKANEDAIATLKTDIQNLDGRIAGFESLLNTTVQKANEAYDIAEKNSTKIEILENNYADLRNELDNLEFLDEEDKAELLAKIDEIRNELSTVKATADEALALAKENLDKANAYTDERVELAINALRNETDLKLADLENAYKNADKELEKRLQDQIDALKASIADVEKRVADNEKKIEELAGKLDKIDKVDESLKQFVSGIILQRAENPVFGSFAFPANIQTNVLMAFYGYAGSYGAQFPTYYPRYYVRAAETLTPKDIQMLGIKPETLAEDGDAIVGSAGKVYVTVNPSNVNFEGQTLPIVNSLDEESGVKLTPLKYSDKKLTFGASTRAAVNGFYEAEATLAPEDINKVKMTFDLNVGELKETVKDVINPIDGVNVSQVASTVFDVVSQLNQQLDANALKASWTDELGVSRNIYSNYNLATTAIKPLSYNFMADAHFTSFPGFDKMRNVAGKLMDKIAGKFKIAFNKMPALDFDIEKISRIQFDNIDINTEDINLDLKVTYKDVIKTTVEIGIDKFVDIDFDQLVNVPSQTFPVEVHVVGDVYDDNGVWVGKYDEFITETITVPSQDILVSIKEQVPFTWTGMVPVEVPVDIEVPVDASELQKLLNEIEGIEDDVNELLTGQSDKVNKIIDMVNSYLDKLEDLTKLTDKIAEIGSKVDDVNNNLKNKIINFLDKAEGKLLTAVNSINKALQPVMLVKTAGSFQKLSQTVYSPTVMTAANVQFIPTSYTAELVAPAFKKLVGVTNVYSMNRSKSAQNGDASCLSALKEANAKAGVAEILNGDTQIVNFSAKKGYIYEVTYTSVDFSGFVVAKKYYVTVK